MPSLKVLRRSGFSFIELVTVVALIAIIVSSAVPVASSLFRRHREMMLRETLLVMRLAIDSFPQNGLDEDQDTRIDEDPRGDANYDGLPGIRNVDDDSDLQTDEDWNYRLPFDAYGAVNRDYDWTFTVDDDEDDTRDEEAYAADLGELAQKMPIMNRRVPVDPVSHNITWDAVILSKNFASFPLANNDSDWYHDGDASGTFSDGDAIVVSTDAVFHEGLDRILHRNLLIQPPDPSDGNPLTALVDEDPRNGLDDDNDGRVDEDAAELVDVRSSTTTQSIDLTPYSSW